MALRNALPVTIRPKGLSDAVDGSNAFDGAMSVLQDLVPNPSTLGQFIPRAASVSVTAFSGFTTPAGVTALLVVGTKAYGFVSSAKNAGKDEPFVYDLAAGVFDTVSNVTAADCPATQSTTGDWTPPTLSMVTPGRIVMTHPGYNGVPNFIGWLDISNFSSTGVTGNTHTSQTIDTLSSDVITVNGWQVGQRITGAGIPVNTFITSINAAGTSITISNAATATTAGVALTVAGGTPAAPLYGAGNTSPIALTAVPACVGQFNGRAYYGVANAATFSDPLLPTQVSGDGGTVVPTLTLGDNTPVTALVGLPLTNQVSGGTTQSLVAFKGAGPYYQITGDAATSNLAASEVNGSVGTLAANTICATPEGLAYIAPDGLRQLSLSGVCSPPVGSDGEGVNVPFLNAVSPTRMCMAFNENTLRVSVQNGNVNGQPVQEYWLHLKRKVWTGPHSFPASLIQAYTGGSGGNTFILAASGINAQLWQSATIPSANSTYIENSVAMSFAWQSVLYPDNQKMSANMIVETSIGAALPQNETLSVLISDEQGNQINQIALSGGQASGSIWDSFDWGAADWGAAQSAFDQYQLEWDQPLIFKQMSLRMTGQSMAGLVLGNLYFRYQPLGYLLK